MKTTLITQREFLRLYGTDDKGNKVWTPQNLRYQRMKAKRPKVRFKDIIGGYRIELIDGSPFIKSV